MKKTIGVLMAAITLSAVAVAPSQATTADITSRMLDKHNAARAAKCGTSGKLATTSGLNDAAQHHADDMARYNYVSHTLHNGTTWSQNISNYSTHDPGGENIAAGQVSVNEVFDAWMASTDHKYNIMFCAYNYMGVGYAKDTDSPWKTFWVTTFAY